MNLNNQCQQSKISCTCYSILLLYAVIIIFISGKAIHRLIKTQASFIELSPMLFCLLQSILHVIQYAFAENNKLQIFTLYIQILTFTSISILFAQLCFQIKSGGLIFKSYMTVKVMQILFYGSIFIVQIVLLFYTSKYTCDKYYYIGIILILLQQIVSTMVADYFGILLLKKLERVSKFIQFKTMNPNAIYDSYAKISVASRVTFLEPKQLTDRKKQIKTVLSQMTITIILYIVLIVIINLNFEQITCEYPDTHTNTQNIIGIIYGIIVMTPCLIIPYAFGYIPKVEMQAIDYQDSIHLDRSKSIPDELYM